MEKRGEGGEGREHRYRAYCLRDSPHNAGRPEQISKSMALLRYQAGDLSYVSDC